MSENWLNADRDTRDGERESRFIHYSANCSTMDDLIAFLTHNCCQGSDCLPKTACCDTTKKRRASWNESLMRPAFGLS